MNPPPAPDEIAAIQASVGNWAPFFAVLSFIAAAAWWVVRTTRKVVTQEEFEDVMTVERERIKGLEAWRATTSITLAETAATTRLVSDQVKDVAARVDRGFDAIQRRLDDWMKERDRRG